MTLIELLVAMFFILQISTAVGAAKDAHASLLGYIVATLLGAAIAVLWIVSFYKVAAHFDGPSENPNNKLTMLLIGLFLSGSLMWEIAGAFFSGWMSAMVLRHIN